MNLQALPIYQGTTMDVPGIPVDVVGSLERSPASAHVIVQTGPEQRKVVVLPIGQTIAQCHRYIGALTGPYGLPVIVWSS